MSNYSTSGVATADGAAPAGTASPASNLTADLPAKAADVVELVVAAINDRAVRPVVIAARAVVFGVLIISLLVAMLVWGSVGLVRLLDVYAWPGKVWASYLLLGGLFTVLGLVAWLFRVDRKADAAA